MVNAILAALGLSLIVGGEAFTFLAGLDALLFWGEEGLIRTGAFVAFGLSLLVAAWVFRHVLRCERELVETAGATR